MPRSPALAWFDSYRNWIAAGVAALDALAYAVDRYRHHVIATSSTALIFMVSWVLLAVVFTVVSAIWEARLEEPGDDG